MSPAGPLNLIFGLLFFVLPFVLPLYVAEARRKEWPYWKWMLSYFFFGAAGGVLGGAIGFLILALTTSGAMSLAAADIILSLCLIVGLLVFTWAATVAISRSLAYRRQLREARETETPPPPRRPRMLRALVIVTAAGYALLVVAFVVGLGAAPSVSCEEAEAAATDVAPAIDEINKSRQQYRVAHEAYGNGEIRVGSFMRGTTAALTRQAQSVDTFARRTESINDPAVREKFSVLADALRTELDIALDLQSAVSASDADAINASASAYDDASKERAQLTTEVTEWFRAAQCSQ